MKNKKEELYKVMKNKWIRILYLVLIVLQLTGCGFTNEKVEWPHKNELIFGTTLSTKSLDPANGYCGWFLVRYGVGETLFRLDDHMEVEMWLADSYEQITPLKWKIKIKEDIFFQNGKKLTPKSVKDALERVIALNSRAKATLKINTIEAGEDYIIIQTLEENPTLINELCDPFAAIIDVESEDIASSPIGTGPFRVEKFNQNGASYFRKNENYWDGEVNLDLIKVIPISDSDTLAMALQSGEIDAAQGLSYGMIHLLKKDSNYVVKSMDTSRAIVMYLNEENQHLSNAHVRKAINMLIDKEKYASSILKDEAVPAIGAFPSYVTDQALALESSIYDKEQAIELLKAEGYGDSNQDGILDKEGENLSFKLVTYSARAELSDIAQAIQNDLKQVGIEVLVEINENIMDVLSSGDFDLCLYSNITSATGDEFAYLNQTMRTDAISNYGHYSNEQVDNLLSQLTVEFDIKKRKELSRAIQQIVLKEDGYHFIAHMKMSFVMKNNVINLVPHPTDYYQFTAKTDIR